MKYILKQVADEDVYVDFDEEVCFKDNFEERAVICGNRQFISFGDKTLIKVIKGDYYDDDPDPRPEYEGDSIGYDYDTLEELEKLTGKKWDVYEMHGYSQGEWQDLYFVEGEVSQKELEYLEDFYMGKVDEYRVYELADDEELNEYESDCYHAFVPHDTSWHGKKAICEYLDLKVENTKVYNTSGCHKVYDYEEIE